VRIIITELILNLFELLPQQIFFLILADPFRNLRLHLALHLQFLDLGGQQHIDLFKSLQRLQSIKELLLIDKIKSQIDRHQVSQFSRFINLVHHLQNFARQGSTIGQSHLE